MTTRVHVEGVGIDIHKHRGGPQPGHDLARGGKGETGTEDRVAGADSPGDEGQDQGVGAVGAAEGVFRLAEGRQIGLELSHLRAHDPGAADHGRLDGGLDPAVEAKALGLKVDKGNAHDRTISGRADGAARFQCRRGCGVLPNRLRQSQILFRHLA